MRHAVAGGLLLLALAMTHQCIFASVQTSPLTIYSGGIGIGAVQSINSELQQDLSKRFLTLSFINTIYFKKNVNVFCDANWFGPGNNYGADLGFDGVFPGSDYSLFVGAGIGALYFDRTNQNFGENFGPSGTVHCGVTFDLTESIQMRFRVPYHIVVNNTRDNTVGFDVGFLFSNPYKKIKKLDYNR